MTDQNDIDKMMKGGSAQPQAAQATQATQATKAHDLSELPTGSSRGAGGGGSLETLLDVSLPVAIEFGRTHMTVQEILELGSGSVIQLDRMVGEPIDIYISDRKLAEGEVVVIGEHFGVRITRIVSGPEPALGAREAV